MIRVVLRIGPTKSCVQKKSNYMLTMYQAFQTQYIWRDPSIHFKNQHTCAFNNHKYIRQSPNFKRIYNNTSSQKFANVTQVQLQKFDWQKLEYMETYPNSDHIPHNLYIEPFSPSRVKLSNTTQSWDGEWDLSLRFLTTILHDFRVGSKDRENNDPVPTPAMRITKGGQ